MTDRTLDAGLASKKHSYYNKVKAISGPSWGARITVSLSNAVDCAKRSGRMA